MRRIIRGRRGRRTTLYRRRALVSVPVLLAALALTPGSGAAQSWTSDWCDGDRRAGREHCEVREYTLEGAAGHLTVNARPNGGIEVEGWDGSEVRVQARVVTRAESAAEASDLAGEVQVRVEAGQVWTDGPRLGRRDRRDDRSWSVSYRILVPEGTDLELEALNGHVRVAGVRGGVSARTTNGSIRLAGVDGIVRVRTTNGSVRAEYDEGFRLGHPAELRTTNGSVELTVPAAFSARLEASTTNGGITTDFPVTVEGRIGRRVSAVLGDGGPELRLATTNGGIRLRRR